MCCLPIKMLEKKIESFYQCKWKGNEIGYYIDKWNPLLIFPKPKFSYKVQICDLKLSTPGPVTNWKILKYKIIFELFELLLDRIVLIIFRNEKYVHSDKTIKIWLIIIITSKVLPVWNFDLRIFSLYGHGVCSCYLFWTHQNSKFALNADTIRLNLV